MVELGNPLVSLLSLVAVGYAIICIVAGSTCCRNTDSLVITIFVIIVMFVWPPLLGVYLVHLCMQKFTLSHAQVARCVGVSVGLGAVSATLYFLFPATSVVVTIAISTALFAASGYILATGYFTHIWPHRRRAIASHFALIKLHPEVFVKKELKLKWAEQRLEAHERHFQSLLEEKDLLEEKILRLINEGDTAVLSMLRGRFERATAKLSAQELHERHDSARDSLGRTPDTDPKCCKRLLETAVYRVALIERTTQLWPGRSYREVVRERDALRRDVDNLARELLSLTQERDESLNNLHALRARRLELN